MFAGILTLALLVVSPIGAVATTPTAAVTSLTTAIPQPTNLVTTAGGSSPYSVSCTSPGSCELVGGYTASSTNQLAALASVDTAGTFGTPQQLQLQLSNEDPALPLALLGSIDCFSAGTCVGVGEYADASRNLQAFFGSSSGGVWTLQEITPPSSPAAAQQLSELSVVSCSSSTSCEAAGEYQNASDVQQPMVAAFNASGGVWTSSVSTIGLPTNADETSNNSAGFLGVSCLSASSCVAVGEYDLDDTNSDLEPLIATESNGAWTVQSVATPSSPPSTDAQVALLESVSCTTPDDCSAVGSYMDSGNVQQAMIALNFPTWFAQRATLPTDALANPSAQLDSVSCWGTGSCEAVGDYANSTGLVPLIVGSDTGAWLPGNSVSPPATTNSSELTGVSCLSTGQCTAVGDYNHGTSTQQLMSLSTAPSIAISTARLSAASVHRAYKATLSATGGSGTYTWAVSSGKLPRGLKLNTVTGKISGTPAKAGTYRFGVQAVDAGPPTQNLTQRFSLRVKAAAIAPPAAPKKK